MVVAVRRAASQCLLLALPSTENSQNASGLG
jgi:hypothetical protein